MLQTAKIRKQFQLLANFSNLSDIHYGRLAKSGILKELALLRFIKFIV
jgi:hypothetical protein